MRLGLLINSFGLAASLTVQSYGAALDSEERLRDELVSAFKQYLEAISRCNAVLRGHTFDYRYSRVSDSGIGARFSLDTVLQSIRTETQEARSFSDLHVILSENYITDVGFKKLVEFLLDPSNKDLLDAISDIDLKSNRISASSANDVKKLLEYAPKLQLDLSINPIAPRDLDSKISGRVSCRAY